MRAQPRIQKYHRRRQRLAQRRRRGGCTRLHRPSLAVAADLPPCRLRNSLDDKLRDALQELTRRACAHQAVTGLLLLCRGDRVQIRVVAERPMTRPVRLLSDAWCADLDEVHPGITWSLEVSDQPPPPDQNYQCLYWCQH